MTLTQLITALTELRDSGVPGETEVVVEGDPNYGGTEFHDASDPTYGELFQLMHGQVVANPKGRSIGQRVIIWR